ncbi:MAG: GAF domain-containing protein, partial [Candidatus Omnitrophica bacterium]|nr:GAF domain-containing protein [Candidatus Omnitrophota bacterium]
MIRQKGQMTPSRNSLVPAAISVISLISALYLIFRFFPQIDTRSSFSVSLIGTAISSLNITILFSYLAFGAFTGVSLTIAAVFVVLWLGLATGFAIYHIFIPSFFITASIGWYFSKAGDKIGRSHLLKSEKLDEELNLLSDGIKRKMIYLKSLKEKLSGYSTLKEVAEGLSTVLSLNDINKLIIEYALRMLKKEGRAFLFLVDVERQELALSASKEAQGPLKVKTKKGDPFDYWVFKYRKPLIVEDVTKDFRFSTESVEEAKAVFRSLIAAPLVSENRITGVLRMDNAKEYTYTQDDLRLLDIISDLGAVAIQNAILYARIQNLAIRDGLT